MGSCLCVSMACSAIVGDVVYIVPLATGWRDSEPAHVQYGRLADS